MSPSVERAYRAHGPALWSYLVRLSGDPDMAEDVLQETFRRLMSRPPRHEANVRGWLFRVATNRLRDLQRAGRRRALLSRVGGLRLHSDPAPSPEQAAESADARERARRMLGALSHRDRAILLMREEGFTHREIAETVGTTTGSIGTMIARALDRVARELEPVEATK